MRTYNLPYRATVVLLTSCCLLLPGCAAVVVGTAAAGLSVLHDRRPIGTIMNDRSIELTSMQRLAHLLETKHAHIDINSYNNRVLIVGQVPSLTVKAQVATIVKKHPSVISVYNALTVAPPASLASVTRDALVSQKIRARLLFKKSVDPTHIKVVTEQRIVYLMGIVSTQTAQRATEATQQVAGIKRIVRLFETPPNTAADEQPV